MIDRSRFVAQLAWALGLCCLFSQPAAAFCGFYVTGADSQLYANATMVVLMRDGTKTVLSIQNNYDGPPEAFALVIPVPTVLTQDSVKTLPRDVFTRVDAMGAPRLVEYWELDPCRPPSADLAGRAASSAGRGGSSSAGGVRVEASFAVGEYDIVILSADDSSSLAGWLTENRYNIPSGADSVLAPYVASGTKFFVAKIDPARVTFNDGQAALSPLRFHYDTPEFSLPIRLGLLNSRGQQDLIVNILAPDRYEVSNRPNALIPTNIRVQEAVRDDFPGFYEALFGRVLEKNPNAVVTEYAWGWSGCDPCPPSAMMLSGNDLLTLGADVTRRVATSGTAGSGGQGGASARPVGINPFSINYTLTRLHYRYASADLTDDLVFERANPIMGGRGTPDQSGELSMDVSDSANVNNFQGRYAILHPWTQPQTCQKPQRGFWGGPPGSGSGAAAQSAPNTALIGAPPRAGALPALLAQSLTALDVTADQPLDPLGAAAAAKGRDAGAAVVDAGVKVSSVSGGGCSCSLSGPQRAAPGWAALSLACAVCAIRWKRRRAIATRPRAVRA